MDARPRVPNHFPGQPFYHSALIHSFIPSTFNNHLLSTYSVPGIVLGAPLTPISGNKLGMAPVMFHGQDHTGKEP